VADHRCRCRGCGWRGALSAAIYSTADGWRVDVYACPECLRLLALGADIEDPPRRAPAPLWRTARRR